MAKIDIFLDMLFHSADQTHLWHLQTNGSGSYALHMALGGYYGAVRLGLDDVAEKCMGYKNIRLSAKGKAALVDWKDVAQVDAHLVITEKYLASLNDEIMKADAKATHLVNAIDVIRECVSKTRYLITLA